jgi:hypothetical protein
VYLSVLVDTYNHERFIEKALGSVLGQNFPARQFEVIVVDDGSTDRTPEIVRQFQPRVRLIRKSNGGQASAFNAGIPECRGEVIVFLDGDDWWTVGKLQRIAEAFAADPPLGMVGHAFVESFADGRERIISTQVPASVRLDGVAGASYFRLSRCYFGTSRLALRAEVARRTLPIPEALVFEADEYLFTLAAALAKSLILPDPLTHYRVHAGNLFLGAGGSLAGERRKAGVLAALANALGAALPSAGAPSGAVALVVEMVEAEADQLRLKVDGGWPWETFATESTIYRIQHADAQWKSKAFRTLSMVPALLLPPKWFYAGRQWLGSQPWYKRARERAVPVPGFSRLDRPATNVPSAEGTNKRGGINASPS